MAGVRSRYGPGGLVGAAQVALDLSPPPWHETRHGWFHCPRLGAPPQDPGSVGARESGRRSGTRRVRREGRRGRGAARGEENHPTPMPRRAAGWAGEYRPRRMVRPTSLDLTTGTIGRRIVQLAWPAILSTLVHNLYGLNDVFFAQYTGVAGQTAVSNNLFVLIAIFGLIQLSAIGTLTLVARRTGAGNEVGAARAAKQGLLFAVALSLLTAVVGWFTAPLVPHLMGMAPDVRAESVVYLRVLFVGMPAMFLFPTVESVFRARGDARTPLLLQVVAVGANVAGNAIAVFGLGAGVAGIAAATILSRVVGVALGLLLLRGGRTGLDLGRGDGGLVELPVWRRIVLVSAPVGARTLLFGLIYQVVSRITAQFGTAAQNGLGVGIRVEGLCFFILVGFGLSAGPMVGQNLGAGRPERAARAAWTAVGMAMVPSLALHGGLRARARGLHVGVRPGRRRPSRTGPSTCASSRCASCSSTSRSCSRTRSWARGTPCPRCSSTCR